MLEQTHDALWVAEGQIVTFFGVPYPTRSAIVRLANGDLWIWSPVKLTADLRAEVDRLGTVRHLVSPNKLHHLYLSEWKAAFPDAQLWGPRSTIKKRPDLEFRAALQDDPPSEWLPDIDQAWFRGSFAMDEIVFLHRPSDTAIVADLIQTFSDTFLRKHWGLVQIPGAPRWSHPGSGLRAARMAMVVHQPRARAAGARQSAGLEVPKSDRGAWRETGLHRPGVSNQVIQMARCLSWFVVYIRLGAGVTSRCGPSAAADERCIDPHRR